MIEVPQSSYLGYRDADENQSDALPVQDKATKLREIIGDRILFAGSYGTGKSEWLVQQCIYDAIKYPGNEILMGRKKLDWFMSSTLPLLMNAIPPELLIRHDQQRHNIEIKTDGKPSIIRYRQLDASREAMSQIKSMNLGLAGIDQIEELEEDVVLTIIGRLRRKKGSRQLLAACNPAGHTWVWKTWIDKRGGVEYKYIESRMWKEGVPPPQCQEDVTFDVTDNPYLPWDYIAHLLNTYPKRWLSRFVFCGWDAFEGLVYPDWNDKIHWIKPFHIPDWWNRYITLDHGRTNPTSIGWYATDTKGNVYRYDGHYESGQFTEYHSEVMKVISKRNGTDYLRWLHGPPHRIYFTEDRKLPLPRDMRSMALIGIVRIMMFQAV